MSSEVFDIFMLNPFTLSVLSMQLGYILYFTFKVALSPSKKVFHSPSKMMKDAFYFVLKPRLKIFKFLSWRFGHVEKVTWLEG